MEEDNDLFPPLRPFQKDGIASLQEGAREGHRCQMVCAPTGSGKTILALKVINQALSKMRTATFICDRTTLIDQTSLVADQYGMNNHGVIQAQHYRFDLDAPFQIASAQTLARRSFPDTDIVVVDEAHTQYGAVINFISQCRGLVIGLSATPFAKGLGKIYTRLVNPATMDELTKSGVLVPLRIFSCTHINMKGAETKSNGEWTDRAVEERGMDILGDVVTEWKKFAFGKKTLVFGSTIKHCDDMCRQFSEEGVSAMTFTSDTPDKERKEILDEFRKPDSTIRVLLSVEALAKGFDVQDIECICDVRPLRKSLSTFIQILGRGLRSSPSTGKTECLLLDFSGNIVRFADDFSDFYFYGLQSLDEGEKLDRVIRKDDENKAPPECPKCGYTPCGKRCISCGYERVSLAVVEHHAGEMQEITVGKKTLATDPLDLYQQICTHMKNNGKPETAKNRAWYMFQNITGAVPNQSWDFYAMPDVPVTENLKRQIKYQHIKYFKSSSYRG